jgi:hypothetical protein
MTSMIDRAREMVLDFCRGACGDHLCPGDIQTLAETQSMTPEEKKELGFDTLFSNTQCAKKIATHLRTCHACRDLVHARRLLIERNRREAAAKRATP